MSTSKCQVFGGLLEILQSQLPRRHTKTRHSDADISDLGFLFFMLLVFSEKNQNLLDIQEHCIRKLGKIEVSQNFCLVFIIDF